MPRRPKSDHPWLWWPEEPVTQVALIGADCLAGSLLVHRLLAQGFDVRALVSDSAFMNRNHQRLDIVKGAWTDSGCLRETLHGASYVLCVKGLAYGLRSSERMAIFLVRLHQIMVEQRIERLLHQASALCRLPGQRLNPHVAWYRHTVALLAGLESRLADHDEALEYMALNMLPDGIKAVVTLPGGWRVRASPPEAPLAVCERPVLVSPSAHDLAAFTLEALRKPELAGRYLYLG